MFVLGPVLFVCRAKARFASLLTKRLLKVLAEFGPCRLPPSGLGVLFFPFPQRVFGFAEDAAYRAEMLPRLIDFSLESVQLLELGDASPSRRGERDRGRRRAAHERTPGCGRYVFSL